MNKTITEGLWNQFTAAIDTLEKAINACPDDQWNENNRSFQDYWYMAYHTIFWLDYYLSDSTENFHPPEPFTMGETDPAGAFPDRVYTKEELITYLNYCRDKFRERIKDLALNAEKKFQNTRRNYSIFEITLYNLRHVQHHAAQLNLLLRQKTNSSPEWTSRGKEEFPEE